MREITGKPIKFIGMGEKIEALEPFHPDRIASRILRNLVEPFVHHAYPISSICASLMPK